MIPRADQIDEIRMTATDTDTAGKDFDRENPPSVHEEYMRKHSGRRNNMHESLFRSYHILEKVKVWLEKGVPAEVLPEWIEHLETPPNDLYAVEQFLKDGVIVKRSKYDELDVKILQALEIAARYGNVKTIRHLRWVIDHMVLFLVSDYDEWVKSRAEDGEDPYKWKKGVRPDDPHPDSRILTPAEVDEQIAELEKVVKDGDDSFEASLLRMLKNQRDGSDEEE